MKEKSAVHKGCIMSALGGSCWAIAGVGGQFLFSEKGLNPEWVVAVRLTLVGLCLLLYLSYKKEKVFSVFQTKKDFRDVVLFGILGAAGCQLTYFWSIQASNAVTATFLCYMAPIFILGYTLFREKRRPIKKEIISCVLVLMGVFLLATHGNITTLQISSTALFWGILSAVMFVFYSVLPQRIMAKYPVMLISGWGMFIGGILSALYFQIWNEQGVYDLESGIVFVIVWIFGTMFAYWLYLTGTKLAGPAKGSLLSTVEPVISLLLSVIFLKEKMVWIDIVGFACILATTIILSLPNEKNSQDAHEP